MYLIFPQGSSKEFFFSICFVELLIFVVYGPCVPSALPGFSRIPNVQLVCSCDHSLDTTAILSQADYAKFPVPAFSAALELTQNPVASTQPSELIPAARGWGWQE